MNELTLDYQRCEEYTARHARHFYLAFRSLPERKRESIYALYAYCQQADSIVDENNEPVPQRLARLELWEQQLESQSGNDPGWMIRALRDTRSRFPMPDQYFTELFAGLRQDLVQTRYTTFDDLWQYAYRVASVVGLLTIEIFGYENQVVPLYAKHLGVALQLTNIMRDVRVDLQKDRVYLPQDELRQFGVTEDDLRQGRETEAWKRLMEYQYERVRFYYTSTEGLLTPEDMKTMRPSEIMKNTYAALLEKIRRRGYPLSLPPVRLSLWHKLWIAWRTPH